MISRAIYVQGSRKLTIELERIDTWLTDSTSVINFPGLVELDGDRLYMTYHRARHGVLEGEPLVSVVSENIGKTWKEVPLDFPLLDRHPATGKNFVDFGSGILGRLSDGTICRIDTQAVDNEKLAVDQSNKDYLLVEQTRFRWRSWTSNGDHIETYVFEVEGVPWGPCFYENYSRLIELDNGDLITALEVHVGEPRTDGPTTSNGKETVKYRFSTSIIRSSDGGRTWRFVTAFHPWDVNPVYGKADREADDGLCEPDLAVLPNGDLLCMMRTGSYSPMFQARSTDGGTTWSMPQTTGWQGVKPRLEVLPNGVLACAAGRGQYGHPQVTHVMLSLDGTGEYWEYPFAFHTGPGCSYTSTMQRNGQLHVIYSHSDFTQEFGANSLPTQAIKCAVLDVKLETSS